MVQFLLVLERKLSFLTFFSLKLPARNKALPSKMLVLRLASVDRLSERNIRAAIVREETPSKPSILPSIRSLAGELNPEVIK